MKRISAIALGLLLIGGRVVAQQYLITTIAGGSLPPTDVPAVTVSLANTNAIAVDGHGNVYFSAAGQGQGGYPSAVFKIDRGGVLTLVAGDVRNAGFSGDGGPATAARLSDPMGLAVDPAGNLYIADFLNNRIRKVAPNGIITTVAGNGSAGYSGDGGPATSAALNGPSAAAVDAAGNLYIADRWNDRIRQVSANGIITTVAGNGTEGNTGDGGPATSAELTPAGVTVDAAGNFYIADNEEGFNNGSIRKVTPDGTITTMANLGTTVPPFSLGGLTVDATGNVFVAGEDVIVKVSPGGTTTIVAGTGIPGHSGDGGPSTSAQLYGASGVAVDPYGDLYIADSGNGVRRVSPSGIITTITGAAGGQNVVVAGDGGSAAGASLISPAAVALGPAGSFYIADVVGVHKVAASGIISTVGQFNTPGGVVVDAGGNLYVSDTGNYRIRKVDPSGAISTIAGNGTQAYSGDGGPATSAELLGPRGLALDTAGNLYFVDYQAYPYICGVNPFDLEPVICTVVTSLVRKVATDGTISTVAGTGTSGYSGDGGPATQAQINAQGGLAFDAAGNLYIADGFVVRKIAVGGTITTVAGNGAQGCTGDGPATTVPLAQPFAVAVDSAGDLFIADAFGNLIRKVAPNGTMTTIAGSCSMANGGYSGDGGPATSAQLNFPEGLAVDAAGRVYIADSGNNAVRLLVPRATSPFLTVAVTHAGDLTQGQTGATYSVAVTNGPAAASNGTVTVTDLVPLGMTLVSMAGTGWNCSGNSCTRTDSLGSGSSYPPIIVTVNVAAGASTLVINQVTVSGGASATISATDLSTVRSLAAQPVLASPANGAAGIVVAPALVWSLSSGATSYDVYLGTSSPPPLATNTTATSYAPAVLNTDATYYWQVVARNEAGTIASDTWSFTTGRPAQGLHFVPVTPCRLADTRYTSTIAGSTSRDFAVPQLGCGIPSTALAYSLNVTAVPKGALSYLTLWPAGQNRPGVSTLNSWSGIVVANAAIVAAGTGGAVSVYVTNEADVVLDINGYFDTSTGTSSYAFYPTTPCRAVDTRGPSGQFGGPILDGPVSREFPLPMSACAPPATSRAYSLNVTVVPDPAKQFLAYLTAWPTGQERPGVSTLNSWTGKVVANAALVSAGTNESVSVFVTDPTDLILDLNGYFASPGSAGALLFYPVAPCRIADTRDLAGPFGGPTMEGEEARSFVIPASRCNIPANAAAYSLNVTVVPDGVLSYLTAWPAGSARPNVSTLNSWDGTLVANAAIVPAGTNGAISIYVTDRTEVILDIDGYFAP